MKNYQLNLGVRITLTDKNGNEHGYQFSSIHPAYQTLNKLCKFLNEILGTYYVVVDSRKLK